MIKSGQILIPLPKTRNTKVKVEVNGVDLTSRVIESVWVKPVTIGVGTFSIKLSNANGQLTNTYKIGQTVKLYADNLDATTLQFQGRIDFVEDDIGNDGQFLKINGRHRSFLLTEFLICYSATEVITSTILSDIIDLLPAGHGITKTNISPSTIPSVVLDIEFSSK